MAKIAFVQNLAFEYLGVMYLSSALKNNGHNVEVFIGNNLKKLSSDVKNYRPDMVGFSCITGNQDWCLKACAAIKEKIAEAVTIFGGPHPTFFPEIIMEPCVDIVCRGEAEKAILELVNKNGNRENLANTCNCWVKHNGQIIKNDLRPLIENLDILAFPDRELYYKKYPFLNRSQKVFIAARGCPFKCSYCFNESLQALYANKGKYMRYRSIQNVIEEIKIVRKKYAMKTVYMLDDTFILNTHWLYGFLLHYKKEINLPLICLVRAGSINRRDCQTIKRSQLL